MRRVEVAWPRCGKCQAPYAVKLGLSLRTGDYRPVWLPDCKCRDREPHVMTDQAGAPLWFPLDNLSPRQQKRADA